jgi:beta-lactamase regulating signal transducer with metallopeptidase domain
MWVLSHSVGVLLLFLVVLAVCRYTRAGPAVRHALWLLVLLKLLTPPFVSWPWPLPLLPADHPDTVQETSTEAAVRDTFSEDEPREPDATLPAVFPPADGDDMPLSPTEEDEMRAENAGPRRDRWIDAAAAIWLLGGLAVAVVQLRRLARFRRGLSHAGPTPAWLVAEVRELATLLKVRPPRLAVLPGLGSPLVWAGGRPCLLWPEGLEEELSPQGCRAVLAHELAHLARRDHWVAWLIFAAGCLWWWQPLFYLVRRRLHREAELACDARVVAALPQTRRAYAEALLDVCQRQSKPTALTPALGVIGRRDLERRLVMIMRADGASRLSPRMLVGIGLLGLIVLPAWTFGQGDRKTPPVEQDKQLQNLERSIQVVLNEVLEERKVAPPQGDRKSSADSTPVQAADRDKKLADLEAKLKALLKEVQDLRASKPAKQGQRRVGNPYENVFKIYPQLSNASLGNVFVWDPASGKKLRVGLEAENKKAAKSAEITLSRTTYSLPGGKAEALGKFLQQHVKGVVMETKIDGDSLIVTTTPEMQRVLGAFIDLTEGKTPPLDIYLRPQPNFQKK